MEEMRLQKYLASCGVASRRKCEELILNGKIEVSNIFLDTFPLKYINQENENYCVTIQKSEEMNDIQYEFNKKGNISSITTKVTLDNGEPKQNTKIILEITLQL